MKINPFVTVKGDLCASHVGQVLHVHLTVVTLEMETDLQSDMGGICRRRTRVQVREKQLSGSLCRGSSQRRNSGQSCTTEEFMDVLTVFKAWQKHYLSSYMSKNVLSEKICTK